MNALNTVDILTFSYKKGTNLIENPVLIKQNETHLILALNTRSLNSPEHIKRLCRAFPIRKMFPLMFSYKMQLVNHLNLLNI